MQQKKEKMVLAPTDLSNFLSCNHCSRRDLDVARGSVERPGCYESVLDALKERGRNGNDNLKMTTSANPILTI